MHKNTVIRARAPLRLGLAGGGTDVSPYCDKFGGLVINATIDRYAYATIELGEGSSIIFEASDRKVTETHSLPQENLIEGKLNLHAAVYRHMVDHFNNGRRISLRLTTFCDAPVGSGLGASSTIVVAMIKAFDELFGAALDDYQIAQIAFKIERIDCQLQGGRQDQYAAAFGGFNFIEFYDNDRTTVNPLRIKNWVICELEASLVLFFSGVSRESAKIIADQSKTVNKDSSEALSAMHALKSEATSMKECILRADFGGIVESMKLGWENKKKTASSVSNPFIDSIYSAAMDAGALAGKISGAGGGGFFLFFVPAERRMSVMSALATFHGQASNCHFTKNGAQSWRVI